MFNEYLKSIYNIIENYKTNSHTFKNMLAINNTLIYNIKNKNYTQNMRGGNIVNVMIAQLELQKNQILSEMETTRASLPTIPHDKIQNIQNTIELAKSLESYVNLLSSISLTPDEYGILARQLSEIRDILNKYIN
jgi:hypothetical protein